MGRLAFFPTRPPLYRPKSSPEARKIRRLRQWTQCRRTVPSKYSSGNPSVQNKKQVTLDRQRKCSEITSKRKFN